MTSTRGYGSPISWRACRIIRPGASTNCYHGTHQHVCFAGIAAEIAEAGDRPFQPDLTHRGGRRDRVVADVVDL
jgi:hypothetical protein